MIGDQEDDRLASQLRGAALSAILNIAEGYGRYHYLDKLRFFYIARGSLTETRSAFTAACTIGHITAEQRDWAHSTEAEDHALSMATFPSFATNAKVARNLVTNRCPKNCRLAYRVPSRRQSLIPDP